MPSQGRPRRRMKERAGVPSQPCDAAPTSQRGLRERERQPQRHAPVARYTHAQGLPTQTHITPITRYYRLTV